MMPGDSEVVMKGPLIVRVYYPSGHRLEITAKEWIGYGVKEGAVALIDEDDEGFVGDSRGYYETAEGIELYNPWDAFRDGVLPLQMAVWMHEHPKWLSEKPIWGGATVDYKQLKRKGGGK